MVADLDRLAVVLVRHRWSETGKLDCFSFRKTKRAERVAGFDQAPDFIVPDEFNP